MRREWEDPMLTVDLGNSRLKACRWKPDGTSYESMGCWEDDVSELAGFRLWLRGWPKRCVALCSVGGAERTRELLALLAEEHARVFVEPDTGLENQCREPERVGADRIYSAAGAASLLGRSAIVVDAGTALTVDVVLVSGAAPAFLGGAIAPGPRLWARALADGTALLPLVEPCPGVHALGQATEEAIRAGIAVGFRGAAAELVEQLARESGLGEATVVLTGGARDFLLVPQPFTRRPLDVVPDLVHRGLLAALRRSTDVRGPS